MSTNIFLKKLSKLVYPIQEEYNTSGIKDRDFVIRKDGRPWQRQREKAGQYLLCSKITCRFSRCLNDITRLPTICIIVQTRSRLKLQWLKSTTCPKARR